MTEKQFSDSELLLRVKEGNEEAFAMLLHRHSSRLYTAIYLIVKDRYVAEDLLQDTFIKALTSIRNGSYTDEGKFAVWIGRIAHNLAVDYYRRSKRYPEIVLEDGSRLMNTLHFADESVEERQIWLDNRSRLRTLIRELPAEQKQVLIMRHYLKMSFQEIADRTGVSINTALGRMRYALINLRKKMVQNPRAYDKNVYPNRSDQVSVSRNYSGRDPGD
jgi:RNA polymerase sigma-70 factor (ECF subfamily)